jgi:hypothetical protein
MPSRAGLDEFIAAVVSGDHAGAIERYYTEDASMQENAVPPRVGRDALVARECCGACARTERDLDLRRLGGRGRPGRDQLGVRICLSFRCKTGRFDEGALQEWRGDRIFRERFLYDSSKPKVDAQGG